MSFAQKKPKLVKAEARDNYGQTWISPLTGTCTHKPGFFCYAVFCCYCASYTNRRDALRGDMTRYVCCNGDWPCSGRMKERDCPEFCLGVEVCCCFAQSVASTRWMLQDELHIKNTKCDNCIIGTMVALQFLSCVCNIVACLIDNPGIDEAAECIDLLADLVWCTVCGCMQTQAKIEMSENPRFTGAPGGAGAPYAAPQAQQMQYGGGAPAAAPPGVPAGYPATQPPGQARMPYPQGNAASYPPPGYPAQH